MNYAQKIMQKINLRRLLANLGVMFMLGLLANTPLAAQSINAVAIQKLALQGTWSAEHPELGNWSWNEEHKVCLRIGTTKGKCADTGTWKIRDNVICYELTWWGKSTGNIKNCLTVQALGHGRYKTLYHGGAMVSTFFNFKVLD